MNEELTKLIEQAINGDTAAFERVVEMKAKQIIYISVKLMRNQQDGEDAAQEAMLKMYRSVDSLKSPDAFHSWMYQIISRTCIDLKRKLTREDHDYLDPEEELNEERREFLPQEYIEDVAKRDFLLTIIDDLPDHYRACLLFFYFEDLSYQEIAQATGSTAKIVENVLRRAKQRIRKQLEDRYGELSSRKIFQGVVAMPVLSQVFQLDADTQVSGEMVMRVVSSVGTAMLGLGAKAVGSVGAASATAQGTSTAGAATATGASVSAGAGTAAGLSTTAKILIGIVATASVAGGATALHLLPEEPPLDLAELMPPAQEEATILTLEDLIGEEAARILKGYAAGTEEPGEWPDFLDHLAMTNLAWVTLEDADLTLYQLAKQDKQLLLLEQWDDNGLAVAYRFTDSQEAPPKKGDLFRSLQGWQQ